MGLGRLGGPGCRVKGVGWGNRALGCKPGVKWEERGRGHTNAEPGRGNLGELQEGGTFIYQALKAFLRLYSAL